MKWFNFLKRPKPLSIKDEIEIPIGSRWVFTPTKRGDPFPVKKGHVVRVIDVKNGWVRYDMGGSIFRDERCSIKDFLGMYVRYYRD